MHPELAPAPVPAPVLIRPTPLFWRALLGAIVVGLAAAAFLLPDALGPRVRAGCGVACFLCLIAAFSSNLRLVNWRTVACGFALQLVLAVAVIRVPVVYRVFDAIVSVVKLLLNFTNEGSRFVFGPLADSGAMERALPKNGSVFAFQVLPTIIFIAAFFSVLYHYGVLQLIVRVMARVMMYLMQTSGAETLSVSANVFMGQTEAPLIVRPYIERMTQSELLTLMVGGMAHISGGLMAAYIGMKADAVAILATSVMAAPCSLYLSKILLPETGDPETRGEVKTAVEGQHVNVIDAACAGASEGMRLALNIAAMLIAFLAFIAMFDAILAAIHETWSLRALFSHVFAPVASLMGVEAKDVPALADLLGTKLVANEFVAYVKYSTDYVEGLTPRDRVLATYALTGFANFASIGIQLGGIGAMAPSRRPDLARLGGRALFVGFVATLLNAAIAGVFID